MVSLVCHSGPVSPGNGSNSTTGSKAKETGDERPRLCPATLRMLQSFLLSFLIGKIQDTKKLRYELDPGTN